MDEMRWDEMRWDQIDESLTDWLTDLPGLQSNKKKHTMNEYELRKKERKKERKKDETEIRYLRFNDYFECILSLSVDE
jgi:hypothetical protein